jgi:UDPglucose 6-dehydrogenase
MRIAVIGTGYVGLVAGTCFADSLERQQRHTLCLDIDEGKINRLRPARCRSTNRASRNSSSATSHDGRLQFHDQLYEEAIPKAQVVFIAVGTPPGEDGSADLKYVLSGASRSRNT